MNKIASFRDAFEGIDMAELDLVDIEIVQTAGVMGIPETGASCCYYFACHCSSCCLDEPNMPGG